MVYVSTKLSGKGDLRNLFGRSTLNSPATSHHHPEIDESDFLGDEEVNLHQSYIGIMRWAVELYLRNHG
jgi:hypothetical protein